MMEKERISLYVSPKAIGLLECIRLNLDSLIRIIDRSKDGYVLEINTANVIESVLQKQVELASELRNMFEGEK